MQTYVILFPLLALSTNAFVFSAVRPISSGQSVSEMVNEIRRDMSMMGCTPRWRPARSVYSSSIIPTVKYLEDFVDEIDRSFGALDAAVAPSPSPRTYRPPIDVKEGNKTFTVSVDLPGVTKEDLKLEIQNSVLTISSERKQAEKEEGETYRLMERFDGLAVRTLQLPENIDSDNIQASFKDGVLTIIVDKIEDEKEKVKTIAIE